jgi:cytochrome oxidase Cu insertion factor (SCO1/SenC/PrrC family)
MGMRAFDGATPVEDIVAYVDRVRTTPALRDDLVGLLPEQAPIYAGRATNEAERLRGYLLATFETTGLPAAATAYVIEELESGRNTYTVAAAAKGMRGARSPPERAVALLLSAIERLRLSDDFVRFDGCPAASGDRSSTTALMELFRTLAWLGPRAGSAVGVLQAMIEPGAARFSGAVRSEIEKAIAAMSRPAPPEARSCCASEVSPTPAEQAAGLSSLSSPEENAESLELQDQDGAILSFGEFFHGRPGVLTFFYTRCMNPEKCSLNITKLARLQRRIREERLHGQVNIAAVTYDPAFDLPRRLHVYGVDRGMIFDDRNRILRTTGTFEPLLIRFDLGVGFGPVTVNRHRLDLFVLDHTGQPTFTFPRMLWHEDEVLAALKTALARV